MDGISPDNMIFLPVHRWNHLEESFSFGNDLVTDPTYVVKKGKIMSFVFRGDDDFRTAFMSMVIARTTVLMPDKEKVMVAVIIPPAFRQEKYLKMILTCQVAWHGNEKHSVISFVKKESILSRTMEKLKNYDVIIDIDSESSIGTSREARVYIDSLNEIKNGRFVFITRKNRTRTIINKGVDVEIDCVAVKIIDEKLSDIIPGKIGARSGHVKMTVLTAIGNRRQYLYFQYPTRFSK
jgi:hypothetical protein